MKPSSPLKSNGAADFSRPAPSGLAHGLNIETVVGVQNHWREFYNPLRALNVPRAIALYDFSRRGLNAELQKRFPYQLTPINLRAFGSSHARHYGIGRII